MFEVDFLSFILGIATYCICGVTCSLVELLLVKTTEIRGRISDRKKDGSKELPCTFADYKKDSSK